MRTPACVIPGILHKSNKGSTDWGWGSNLLAYGCQSSVVVLDPKSLQTIQVLERYKSPIVAVKWARENYHHDLSNPYALTLAAADAQGRILIWDVLQGSVKAEFSDTASSSTSSVPPVTDLHWLASVQDASHDLLVALHPPYSVILWNADSGAKIWKKNYSDPLTRFAFDPYDPANVTFLVPDGILFVTDFSINRCPPSNGQKFYISTNSSSANAGVGTGGSGSLDRKRKESSLRSKMRMLVIGESESIAGLEDVVLPNECLQLVYHRAVRRHLLLVYPKEILIMDLAIKQTVGVIQLERGGSSFSRIIPCRQSDVIFCLHETGVISLRARQCDQSAKTLHFLKDDASAEIDLSIEMTYDTLCYSDPLRLTRHLEVSGFGCSPISENSLALVLSDGRTIIWNVMIGYDDDVQAENGVDWPQVPYPGRLPFTSNITSPEHSIRHQFSRVSKCLARYEPGSKSEGPRPQLQMLMTGLHPGTVGQTALIRVQNSSYEKQI